MTLASAGWSVVDVEPCPDCDVATVKGVCPSCGAFVFTVPAASKMLTANRAGSDRYARGRVVQEWQANTRQALRAFRIPPFTERAEIVTSWHGTKNVRRDGANSYPTVKAIIDAMVKEGVLADDDHAHLYGPIMLVGRKRHAATITVAIRRHIPRRTIMTEHEVPW